MMFNPSGLGRHPHEPPGGDVVENLAAGQDLLLLFEGRHRERDADRIADARTEQLLECPLGLQDALGRHARLGHSQVQRHVGTPGGEGPIGLDHRRRVGVFQRNHVAGEAQLVQQLAVFQGALDHGSDAILLGILLPLGRIDRTAIHAYADGTVVRAGHVDKELHFVLPRLGSFVVVQMARIVANLVDHRGDVGGQAIVLLKVAGEISPRPLADLGQRLGVGLGINRHADDIGSGSDQMLDLGERRFDVGRLRGAHALYGNRIAIADGQGANLYRTSWISGGLGHGGGVFCDGEVNLRFCREPIFAHGLCRAAVRRRRKVVGAMDRTIALSPVPPN